MASFFKQKLSLPAASPSQLCINLSKYSLLLTGLLLWSACSGGQKTLATGEELHEELKEYSLVQKENEKGILEYHVKDPSGELLPNGYMKSRLMFELLPARKGENFRVYITSDEYIVKQMTHKETIARRADKGGDSFICSELKAFNRINWSDEQSVSISLSPHTGNFTRVSVEQPSRIRKITNILRDDVTRWRMEFPNKVIEPTSFRVHYFLALKGDQSKDQIKEYLKTRVLSY
jgi:hypothetical protein